MARIANPPPFHRSSSIQLDQRHSHMDEDGLSILDDTILDSDATSMSPVHNRRESFVEKHVYAASDSAWSGYQYGSMDHMSIRSADGTSQPLVEQGGQPYDRVATSQSVNYPDQTPAWQMNSTSGSCTPTAGYDGMSSDYTSGVMSSFSPNATHSSATNTFESLQLRTVPTFLPNIATSTSPQSGKDWMSNSSSEQTGEWSTPQNPHLHSPTYGTNLHLLRRDGIRKKNARFEIPAERNLRTIDHLINQTNDEQEIKELKQQKRLLRNRQAALDSRQRKKQHTERLEEEKKHFTSIINDLEEALGEMKLREQEWAREKEGWAVSQQQHKQYIDTLLMEKEELVRCHTIESGELRKKNSFLIEQIQRMESTAMSTAPSSTGFSADFSDFDHLTMQSSPWENFSVMNEFSIETTPPVEAPTVSLAQAKPAIKDDDKSATSSFLFLLLLCGAWVASRSSTSNTLLPDLPEDVKVASAAVLDHIYQDAGLQPQQLSRATKYESQAGDMAAQQHHRKTTLNALEMASISHSPLDSLHRRLTSPTEEQLRDQAFSLSATQYNSISGGASYEAPRPPPPSGRRNLEEALSAIRKRGEGPAADIYTRSLMWDRVPSEVVRDFARMVASSNPGGQWKSEAIG
ncbi:MAG: hypothetical protein MMC33_007955 [Icmadophila ericetorum]|nr:hypothetical protein [Icmadophila ericetorum]